MITTPLKCAENRDDAKIAAQKARNQLLSFLGEPPFETRQPLLPYCLSTSRDSGLIRMKVRYGTEDNDIIWAWLLIPSGIPFTAADFEHPAEGSNAKLGEKLPAVICLPGSFMTPNHGKDAPAGIVDPETPGDPEAYGRDLARLGYVALCPDLPSSGERTPPGLRSHDTTVIAQRFPEWTRMGMSVWDVSRAVDLLEHLSIVDSSRIGITGWSQGGITAMFGAAMDPRIAATVSVCGWSPIAGLPEEQIDGLSADCNFPALRHYRDTGRQLPFDFDQIAAAIAPRPFLDIRGSKDRFFPNRKEIDASNRELAATYRLFGAPEKYRSYWFEGPHGHNRHAARESQGWFYRWLWE